MIFAKYYPIPIPQIPQWAVVAAMMVGVLVVAGGIILFYFKKRD